MRESTLGKTDTEKPLRREAVRRELVQRLGSLLPEQEALVYELVCILGLAPVARRVLHRLSGVDTQADGQLGLLAELVALRASVPPVTPDGEVSAQVQKLMAQDSGHGCLRQLNESWSQLGPVLRSQVVAFVRALADAEPLAAAASARAAIQQAIKEDGLGAAAGDLSGLES